MLFARRVLVVLAFVFAAIGADAQDPAVVASCGPGVPTPVAAARQPVSAFEAHLTAVAARPARVAAPGLCLQAVPDVETSSRLDQRWEAGEWESYRRAFLTADAEGRLVERIHERPDGEGWVGETWELLSYPGGDGLAIEIRRWAEGAWAQQVRAAYLYRPDGRSLGDVTERWDPDAEVWVVTSRKTVTYDGEDRQTEVLEEGRSALSDPLTPARRTVTTYAADGREIVDVSQDWRGDWRNVVRWTTATDADGRPLVRLYERWDQGAWTLDSRALYTYGQGEDEIVSQLWDSDAGVWENAYRTVEQTSADARELVTTHFGWPEDTTEWVRLDQAVRRLDGEGRTVGYETRQWGGDDWVPERRLRRTYQDDWLVEETDERWDAATATWRRWFVRDVTLRDDAQPLRLSDRWYASDGATLADGSDVVWTYDDQGRVTSRTDTDYDDALGWVPSFRSLYAYDGTAVARDAGPAAGLRLAVRPNPMVAGGEVRVEAAAGPLRVDVFDVLGRRVVTLHDGVVGAGTQTVAMPAAGLAPGAYVVRATAGDRVASLRLTVAR